MEHERPNCECHGEPMRWHKDKRLAKGGWWRCAVKARSYVRKWKSENLDRDRELTRSWERSHPWSNHHLSNDGYFDLLVEQDGRCKGCGVTLRDYWEQRGRPDQKVFFEVDHDHDCCPTTNGSSCGNCILGLVCASCNTNEVLHATMMKLPN